MPKSATFSRAKNIQTLLEPHRNNDLDYRKDPKLWSEVYSPKKEFEIFQELVDTALATGEKIHIENVSLAEELEYIESLYMKLGYFDE